VAADAATTPNTNPDETGIAALAYQLWLDRGCPIGSDQDDWFRAESLLKSRSEDASEQPPAAG
jgi:hypothetical protein